MVDVENSLWHLERFNVIKTLSPAEKMQLKSLVCMKEFKKGDPIYLPSNYKGHVYFLKTGNVKVSRITNDGAEQVLDILAPGELFGGLIFAEEPIKKDEMAVALKDTLICYLDANTWNIFILENHKFNMSIMKLVGLKLRKLEIRIEQLQFLNTKDRIITVLRELADKHGKKLAGDYGIEIKVNLTHSDIAKLAGSSRQSVTTILRGLQDNKIIDYDKKRIVLRDYNAVATTASS